MDASDIFVAVTAVAFIVVAAGAGYLYLQEPEDPPTFEQTEELRFEVVDDWEDPGPSDRFDVDEIEGYVLEYTNEFRAEEGLEPLNSNDFMLDLARSHSRDMASHGYVGHVDSEGVHTEERLQEFQPEPCGEATGENTAAVLHGVREHDPWLEETVVNHDEEDVARSLLHTWMDSELHRENILDEDFASVAVGVYVSEASAAFATQKFCG